MMTKKLSILILLSCIFLTACGIKLEKIDIENEYIVFCEFPSYINDTRLVNKPELHDSDLLKVKKMLNLDFYIKNYSATSDKPIEIFVADSKKFKIEKSLRTRPIGLSTAFNTRRAVLIVSNNGEQYVYNRFLDKFYEEIKHDCIK